MRAAGEAVRLEELGLFRRGRGGVVTSLKEALSPKRWLVLGIRFLLREVYTPVAPVSIDGLVSAYMLHPGDRPPDPDAR